MDPKKLTSLLKMTPSNSWKVGEPRQTPIGTPLKGVNRETFWTTRLVKKRFATNAGRSLEAALSQELENLQTYSALLTRIHRAGGNAELFVGIFGEAGANFGSRLDSKLLAGLAKLRLSLDLDIYP